MIKVCAWCNHVIDVDGLPSMRFDEVVVMGKTVTHGMCKTCKVKEQVWSILSYILNVEKNNLE